MVRVVGLCGTLESSAAVGSNHGEAQPFSEENKVPHKLSCQHWCSLAFALVFSQKIHHQ
jgi:hypothetical protein